MLLQRRENKMESSRPAPANFGLLAKTLTKILRFRRAAVGSGGGEGIGVAPHNDDGIHKLKLSRNLDENSTILAVPGDGVKGDLEPEKQKLAAYNREAMESLLANLFAGISAVKAAYAQLQMAQSPYDPNTIQSADLSVVSELKRLSELKHSYFKKQLHPHPPPSAQPTLAAQIQEQRNLLKTYQITTRKLESELQLKNSEIPSLQSQLLESDNQSRALEAKLHPGRSLAALDDLHLSGLNPTHFLAVLRYTVKSIRSFVKQMVHEMESGGWDLDAAAGTIHPGVLRYKLGHRAFTFESYVCQKMFSNFQNQDFGLCAFADCHSWDRRRFFEEFSELKLLKPKLFLERIEKFCRAKYLGLMHPKMEAAFFGDQEQRVLVSSGPGFPDSKFFEGFAEMARHIWLLHCLFFSFGTEGVEAASIFRARTGCRFSEVYMESVVEDEGVGRAKPVVGFTVVPGFRVGRTVIQCKVYLSSGPDIGRQL